MSKNKLEKQIALYNNAVSLLIYSRQVTWSRNAVMLTANSILIGIIGLSFQVQLPFLNMYQNDSINIFLSLFGISICFLWLILLRRSATYNLYYLCLVRELEEKYFSDLDINLIRRCVKLSAGKEVNFKFNKGLDKHKKVKIPFPYWMDNERIICSIIFLFIVLYALTIFYYSHFDFL